MVGVAVHIYPPDTGQSQNLTVRRSDLIRLTPYNFKPCVSIVCDIRKKGLCKIILQIKHRNVEFILQKILQSHSFLMSRKCETQRWKCYGVKRIKSITANNGNRVEQGLGHPFTT